jgi:23S rRNA pseudouridine955/2504/2580 synthase
MKEYQVPASQKEQRFDKYLTKILPSASKSFLYKMLRKKNITLNNKKADGSEHLQEGDVVRIFFSDETFEKFSKASTMVVQKSKVTLSVIYEDEDILLVNKPVGVLTQKAKAQDYSLNEQILDYLMGNNKVTNLFKPSVCNRLDYNTSGIVTAGITYQGARYLNEVFKDRSVHKHYLAFVCGVMKEDIHQKAYLVKDEKTNQVSIYDKKREGAVPIETKYHPLGNNGQYTLVEVELITGKSHQIRAHLQSLSYPIVGDGKYGNVKENAKFFKKYHLNHQLLHAFSLEFSDGRKFKADLPKLYQRILKEEGLLSYVNME